MTSLQAPPSRRHEWRTTDADESSVRRLAERVALKLAVGDVIALHGDLGAGKTTFARALIRAVLGDANAEIPSPTFSLVQTYACKRLDIAHLDLYRLGGEDELTELGLDESLASGAALVEWPERAPGLRAENRLDIHLVQGTGADERTIDFVGTGSWAPRLERIAGMSKFLDGVPPWNEAVAAYLQGDASARAYARLDSNGDKAILMDQPRQPDGPPIRNGLPYSRISQLAEDVHPFVAVASALREAGLSAPEIYGSDLDGGFLLLEDFGDRVFGQEVANGADQAELWRAATEALLVLSTLPVPDAIALPGGNIHHVPPQDRNVLGIEVELLPDWYWPAIHGKPIPSVVRNEFLEIWERIFARLASERKGWVLRDFHSPNLVWLPDREGFRRAGLLDFQDALLGSLAYDLVSLLQDARLDVPAALEDELLTYYLRMRAAIEPTFDAEGFRFAYAALGVQRNTKILGIFARLAMRDGKRAYLRHIPRIWRYVTRGLAHSDLADLRGWFDRHLPDAIRHEPPDVPLHNPLI
jgi:tRNA threonylcarbamoyl adenosine modification protein YjeE